MIGSVPFVTVLHLLFGLLTAEICRSQVVVQRKTHELAMVVEGDTATLTCEAMVAAGGAAPKVSWRKNNLLIVPAANVQVSSRALSNGRRSDLTIRNAKASDRGWYTCVAQNLEQLDAVDFSLDVQEPVRLLSTRVSWMQVLPNSRVILPCIATAYPTPTITWLKDGAELNSVANRSIDSRLGWLTLQDVTAGDEGNYTCRALSQLVRPIIVEHTITLIVEPVIMGGSYPVNLNATVAQARVGQTATLVANIMPVTSAPVTYSWQRNGQVERTETSLSATAGRAFEVALAKLVISAADAGVYTITVDGNTTAVAGAIDVINGPVLAPTTSSKVSIVALSVGSRRAYIGCRASGRPVPSVTLSKKGLLLATSSTGLVQRSMAVLTGDAPVAFVCVAGSSTATVTLDQINPCSGTSQNHITNPTGAYSPASTWNITQPYGLAVDSQSGNGYFTTKARPGTDSGALSRYMGISIGLAVVSYSFRMRMENSSASPGAQAVATLDFLQRGPAEMAVTDSALQQRVFLTNSSTWTWFHQNITAPPDTLTRAVRLTLSTRLAVNASTEATADFDTLCVRFFVTPNARPVFISVFTSVYSVFIGYPITLDCTAEGKPKVTYTWTANGSPVPGATTAKYTLTPRTKSEAGRYSCSSESRTLAGALIGSITQSTVLQVNDVVHPTVLPTTSNGTNAIKNKAVNLTCPITGAPLSFTWLKGTSVVTNVPNRVAWQAGSPTLLVYSALLADAGQYECRANNTGGTARAFVSLRVFTAPELKPNAKANYTQRVTYGARVTLTCPLVGDPAPMISWFVNGKMASVLNSIDAIVNETTDALDFHYVSSFPDPILITCEGRNTYGTSDPVRFTLGSSVGPTPSTAPTTTLEWWLILGPFGLLERWIWICILAGVLVLLILLVICICRCCQKRKRRSITPIRNALQYSASQRSTDTVRTNATYHKESEDVSFIALNPSAHAPPDPPMQTHPTGGNNYQQMGTSRNGGAAPPSYNHATSMPAPPGSRSVPPPPLPNMDSHPVLIRESTLQSRQTSAAQMGDVEADGDNYMLPDQPDSGHDAMAARPPAPVPAVVPGAPTVSPLEPLLQQQQQQDYVNVDARPPAPLPGTENYENFNP